MGATAHDRRGLLERAEARLAIPSSDALHLARDLTGLSGIPFPLLDALAALWDEYMPAKKHDRDLWLRVGALRAAARESVRLTRERLPFRDPFDLAAGEARPEVALALRAAGERLQGALAAVGALLASAEVAAEERAHGVSAVRALFDGDALRDGALLEPEPRRGLEDALRALEGALASGDLAGAKDSLRGVEALAGVRHGDGGGVGNGDQGASGGDDAEAPRA